MPKAQRAVATALPLTIMVFRRSSSGKMYDFLHVKQRVRELDEGPGDLEQLRSFRERRILPQPGVKDTFTNPSLHSYASYRVLTALRPVVYSQPSCRGGKRGQNINKMHIPQLASLLAPPELASVLFLCSMF